MWYKMIVVWPEATIPVLQIQNDIQQQVELLGGNYVRHKVNL